MLLPVVHEDEDGVVAGELLRGDVDEFEALPGLGHADHGEGGEGLHHGGALACVTVMTLDSSKITKVKLARVSLPVRRGDGSVRLAKLLGCLRLKRTHTCGCSAWRSVQY